MESTAAPVPVPRADLTRQAVTGAATAIAIVANAAANILPLNGLRTGEISDRFAVLVVPAGYVFSIWGLIYIGLIAFTIQQARPSQAANPRLRRLGYLPAVSSLLNGAWIFAWHWEVFPLTILVMIGLLATLLLILQRLGAGRLAARGLERWAVNVPWAVYTGWITVATIANVAVVLRWAGFTGAGLDPRLWAVAVLLTGFGIAAAYTARQRSIAYGLVIVWAYAGILVKEVATPAVAVTAGLTAAGMAFLVVAVALARRTAPGASPGLGEAVLGR